MTQNFLPTGSRFATLLGNPPMMYCASRVWWVAVAALACTRPSAESRASRPVDSTAVAPAATQGSADSAFHAMQGRGMMAMGGSVMAAKRAVITYTVTDLPRGGALRITTHDPAAIKAVHNFLAFQRDDHRAEQ
jgi:hypothetical protein